MNKTIPIARNPDYCCDGFEWYGCHYRCVNLDIDGFDLRCLAGIPLDEDQWPPEMNCPRRIESQTTESIYSEVIISFNHPRRKNEEDPRT